VRRHLRREDVYGARQLRASRVAAPNEAGSILVLALLVSLILLGAGLTIMWIASSGSKVAGNVTRRHEALTAAEAGLQRARAVLATLTGDDWNAVLKACHSKDDAPSTTNPNGKGYVLCDRTQGTPAIVDWPVLNAGSAVLTTPGAQNTGNMNYTLYIRNDEPEAGATYSQTDSDHRVVVRSEGKARDGVSQVVVEAVLVRATVTSTSVSTMPAYSQEGLSAAGGNSGRVRLGTN
jgi:Tfp pilus assembly protein PilX